jgi:hypothetical protein
MNAQQQAFLDQAQSDYAVYQFLNGQAACHRLHYLQMATEKLGKAYFWGTTTPPRNIHEYFYRFLRAISTRQDIAAAIGFANAQDLTTVINRVIGLADALAAR